MSRNTYLGVAKSFLIWSFTLAVCLLVVGFPIIVLMATVGALLALILHSVMPIGGVLFAAGSIIGINLLAVLIGAAILTVRKINPEEVKWLGWLHGESTSVNTVVYASCPLTCELSKLR
ncbi:MAG: hypothetical protein D6756_10960 [Cyanobacteria bacterium J083]|nr:MAG: hypothetical protein D6756_10960 [Cyanobacteria bacterium J083]